MKLLILGDLHYPTLDDDDLEICQIRDELYRSFFHIIAQEAPDAYICCGDLTNSGTLEDLKSLLALTGELPAPLYIVLGNHDTHGCSKEDFAAITGQPLYYSLHIGGTKLIFLDTTMESCIDDWVGVMDDNEYRWLEQEMSGDEASVILIAHHPVENTTRRSDEYKLRLSRDISALLAKKSCGLYLNGHNHYHSIAERDGWLFVQTGDFLSHLDYRIAELDGHKLSISTTQLGNVLKGTDQLAQKMKRYTLYTDLHYDQCDLSWKGDLSSAAHEGGIPK